VARAVRQVEQVRFRADEQAPIVEWMKRLSAAGDGWVNLVLRTDGDEERPTSLQFFTLFGGDRTGATMCTWVPGAQRRRGKAQPTLGFTHVTGRRAVAQLQSVGIPVPEHWVVEQDHARRGLVLRLDDETAEEQVLAWAVRALAALAPGPAESWRADVHLPLP
jgi:hypothetical protein